MLHSFPIPRTSIRLTGKDRARFLHNFCTADIIGMTQGQVREAMILDAKGRLLGLVHVFCLEDSLEINTVPMQGEPLIRHLDRYIIREDVQLADESGRFRHVLVFSASKKIDKASELPPPPSICPENCFQSLGDSTPATGRVAVGDFAGPASLYSFARDLPENVIRDCLPTETNPGDANALNLHRIQARCPWFGIDCDNNNLPQELQRDAAAISFTKGCYLGQETVARIDAMGHVNRLLVSLKSVASGEPPPAGTDLLSDEKPVGKLTSIAMDCDGFWHALAIVRRPMAKTGVSLQTPAGPVIVQ